MTRHANLSPQAPGFLIFDELKTRGWTQRDLADIMDVSIGRVSGIVTGRRSMTVNMARGLAAAFGTEAQFWLNMGTAYQLSKKVAPYHGGIGRLPTRLAHQTTDNKGER